MSASEKHVFKNDGHATSLLEKMLSFYNEEELFDTIILAGDNGVKIHANRVILSAFSEYFLETFRGSNTSLGGNVVELKEIEPTALKLVIDYIYSGCIELSLENSEDLLRIAAFLKIQTMIDGCYGFIEKHAINKKNCIKWLSLSKELNLSELKEKSLTYTYNHFEEISKENEILLLNEIELKDLLFNDNPHGDFEEHVFLAMVAWVEYDKVQRQHLLFQLLKMVRYKYLSPKFIVTQRRSVCKTMESYELICSWLQWHLAPETMNIEEQTIDLKPREGDEKLAVVCCLKWDEVVIQTWNSVEDSWSIQRKIPLWKEKIYCSAIVIDERLIIVGGWIQGGSLTNSVECLDLRTMKWTDLPPMRYGRSDSQLFNLNGNLVVFGGEDGNTVLLNTMEIYDFSTCKWHEHQMSVQLEYSNVAAYNEKLYILNFGNGILQCYDDHSKQWTSKSIIKQDLHGFGFAAVGEFLYVIGGRNKQSVSTNSVKRYNLSNESWCKVKPLLKSQCNIQTKVFDNKILNFCFNEKLIQEYNPETDTWRNLCPLAIYGGFYVTFFCTYPNKL